MSSPTPELPPEPGTVPDLEHGMPGPAVPHHDDDDYHDPGPTSHDDETEPDELDGQIDSDEVDDGLLEPVDDEATR